MESILVRYPTGGLLGFETFREALRASELDPRADLAYQDSKILKNLELQYTYYHDNDIIFYLCTSKYLIMFINKSMTISWVIVDSVDESLKYNYNINDYNILFEDTNNKFEWRKRTILETIKSEKLNLIYPSNDFIFLYFGDFILKLSILINSGNNSGFIFFTLTA